MPPEALPAKASEIVPVGAIDSRCELRMPDWRICCLSASGRREAKCGAARYLSASNSGKAPFSRGQFDRGFVGDVAHVFGDAAGHGARALRCRSAG